MDNGKCANCGSEFKRINKNIKKFCTRRCRDMVRNRNHVIKSPLSGLTTGTSGAISELMVSCQMLKSGYSIFRAVSPSCFCDLIAVKGKDIFRVEVTTGTKYKNGKVYHYKRDFYKFDILGVIIHADSSIAYFKSDGKELSKMEI